jgi:ABC-type multidrug transport system ATPase subunit
MIQGKTVIMVTHRKPLLALMDVVYVLQDGQLVDVNQLGGLDVYLGQLEGIEQQEATQEIESESLQNESFISTIAEYFAGNRMIEEGVDSNKQVETHTENQQKIVNEIHPNDPDNSSDEISINLH